MTWFEALTGFREESPHQVRQNFELISATQLKSRVNGRVMTCGRFETPTLGELRQRAASCLMPAVKTTLHERVGDVRQLHGERSHGRSLFQVASQFNALEMAAPTVVPEEGVGIYEYDHTQGPLCAIACGAGTIYRNYFVPLQGQHGQSAERQIDCLADVGAALGNGDGSLWKMQNGYAFPTPTGLAAINHTLRQCDEQERDELLSRLRIGLQWDTEVTLQENYEPHLVTQAYCSGLPINYSRLPSEQWQSFARLILDAAYEATLCAAVLNFNAGGSSRVFLTLVGGGVFGNRVEWILDAIHRALRRHANAGLHVEIVSYRKSNPQVQAAIEQWRSKVV